MRVFLKISPIIFFLFVQSIFSQTVSNQSQLNTAIANASAGATIVLSNGVWNNLQIDINKSATAANPIIIKAETIGNVFIEGNSNIQLGGSYIVFEGFVFQNPSNLISRQSGSKTIIDAIIEFRSSNNNNCNNCTVTNIKIDAYNGTPAQETDTFKWILVHGSNNEISHSSFIGKNGVGSIINHNRSNDILDKTKIHHNYFADRIPVNNDVTGLNDQDAIRLGTSSTSLSDSFSEVYDNFFNNWAGEVEIISNKSGKNKYYNNTFRDYQGTLTLRHGDGCDVFNNFFFANENLFSGGVRVIGEDHKIYNNYFEGLRYRKPSGSGSNTTGALNITNGTPNSALNGYYQPKNIQIVNNTLVNCDLGIRVGTVQNSSTTLAPENVTVANNIILDAGISAFQEVSEPIGSSVYEGNITQNGSWDLTNGVDNNQIVTSGLLEPATDLYRLATGSAAINAGIGSYVFLTKDILGGNRPSNFDAGAEEFAANGTKLPYYVADVGTKIGFLSGNTNRLEVSVSEVNFNISGGTSTFEVASNVSWSVSESVSWLSVNSTSGVNDDTVEIIVQENTSGAERSAVITISEDGGALSSTITVNQSVMVFNSNDAEAISGITVTGVGTQAPNIPENTLDGDFSTRWSANAEDGSAYLTYDLQCRKTVSSVKIYFHKGNSRTSSFKITTSADGINFSDATSVLTSSGTTVGFEEFTISPNSTVQYVRVLGYGNSENSGWNSYEEVEIYGNNSCEVLSINDVSEKSENIIIYPVPAKDGYITVISNKNKMDSIKIFDVQGKLLRKQKIDTNSAKIDAITIWAVTISPEPFRSESL